MRRTISLTIACTQLAQTGERGRCAGSICSMSMMVGTAHGLQGNAKAHEEAAAAAAADAHFEDDQVSLCCSVGAAAALALHRRDVQEC